MNQDGSSSSSIGSADKASSSSGGSTQGGFVATIRRVWAEGVQKMTKRKNDGDAEDVQQRMKRKIDGDDRAANEQQGNKTKKKRTRRGNKRRDSEGLTTSSAPSTTSNTASSSSSSTTSVLGDSGGSRTHQNIVTEARQSVRDKKRKIDELTAAMTAPTAHNEPEPELPVKPKKKPKKVKKSKRQKLLHHSNTNSADPSIDLVAAQLKTKDLRDFLLWLYAVQATPSPAVFFSNPTNLPATVLVVIRSLGQNELIKHKDLLKNLLTKDEGGVFQKVSAFTAPGSKYRVFETMATLILAEGNTQKKVSPSAAKEVEKEIAILLQEQYQELVSKLPDPTRRASLFEEFVATQEELRANKFPIYGVSKPEDFTLGSSNRVPPDLSLFVRLPKKLQTKEGVKPRHLPIVAIDCEMCRTEDGHELTRISVIDDNYNVLYDQLVKPHKPIVDYLTRWSGITEQMLQDVTTSLEDVHKALYELGITRKTIITGHSLENDMMALRLFHKRIIDTTMHFPHANGPPFKNSLRYLTEKFLKRLIQRGHEGHCSVEDAKAVMELVLLRVVQAGVQVNKSGDVEVSDKDDGGNLFIKVRNANKKVTVIDRHVALQKYVPPQRTPGPAAAFLPGSSSSSSSSSGGDGLLPRPSPLASSSSSSTFVPPPNLLTTCACTTDDEIVERLTAHLGSDHRADLIFTQLHTFEDYFAARARQLAPGASPSAAPGLLPTPTISFEEHLKDVDARVGRIYDALPPNGLLVVLTGRGPIIDVFRMQREKKDEGPAWTPERDRALQMAVDSARMGRTFWTVKPPSEAVTTTSTATAETNEPSASESSMTQ